MTAHQTVDVWGIRRPDPDRHYGETGERDDSD
jgi:hypothetical protein